MSLLLQALMSSESCATWAEFRAWQGKAAAHPSDMNMQQVLQHPRMPAHLRSLYLEIEAQRTGGRHWDWTFGTDIYKVLQLPPQQ